MTLTPGRIEVMARELAARSDRDVAEAIKRYDAQDKIALKHAVQMAREAQGITLDGAATSSRPVRVQRRTKPPSSAPSSKRP